MKSAILALILILILSFMLVPAAFAQEGAPECDPLTVRASVTCRDEAAVVDWFATSPDTIPVSPVALGLNSGVQRYGPFEFAGRNAFGEIYTAFLGRVTGVQFYQAGTRTGEVGLYIDCYADAFAELPPDLRMSHVCKTAAQTEVHFVVNQLPDGVVYHGEVVFSGIADGEPFIDWIAPFTKRSGPVAHYTLTLDHPVSTMTIAVGSVYIDAAYIGLANPGPVVVGDCEPNAVKLTGLSARSWSAFFGNRNGCGLMGYAPCVVSDAGSGYVKVNCGYYTTAPKNIATYRAFRLGDAVSVFGCISLDKSGQPTILTAPLTVKRSSR
jgi:hypothetical protein